MESLDKCIACELCIRNKPVSGYGNPNADIMIVLPSPTYYAVKEGNALAGASGELLLKLLKMCNIPEDAVYITHLVKGRSSTLKVKNVTACKPYFKEELESVNPRIIVTMGTLPLKMITKSNLPIEVYANKAIVAKDKTLVLPMYNLAYITRDVRHHGLALRDFVNLYKLYSRFVNPNIKQFESTLHSAVKTILELEERV